MFMRNVQFQPRAAAIRTETPIAPLSGYASGGQVSRIGLVATLAVIAALLAGVALVSVASLATAAVRVAPLGIKQGLASTVAGAGQSVSVEADLSSQTSTAVQLPR